MTSQISTPSKKQSRHGTWVFGTTLEAFQCQRQDDKAISHSLSRAPQTLRHHQPPDRGSPFTGSACDASSDVSLQSKPRRTGQSPQSGAAPLRSPLQPCPSADPDQQTQVSPSAALLHRRRARFHETPCTWIVIVSARGDRAAAAIKAPFWLVQLLMGRFYRD
jgi:hypothetical protein